MRCDYAGCQNKATVEYDAWVLCDRHHKMAERAFYFQQGLTLGAAAAFLDQIFDG